MFTSFLVKWSIRPWRSSGSVSAHYFWRTLQSKTTVPLSLLLLWSANVYFSFVCNFFSFLKHYLFWLSPYQRILIWAETDLWGSRAQVHCKYVKGANVSVCSVIRVRDDLSQLSPFHLILHMPGMESFCQPRNQCNHCPSVPVFCAHRMLGTLSPSQVSPGSPGIDLFLLGVCIADKYLLSLMHTGSLFTGPYLCLCLCIFIDMWIETFWGARPCAEMSVPR